MPLYNNLNRLDKTISKKYICLGIVGDTNFTNFQQFSDQFSENVQKLLTGSTRQFQKYICWGIVGDTNFTNFHQFWDQFSEIVQKILTGSTRQFQKHIYVGVL